MENSVATSSKRKKKLTEHSKVGLSIECPSKFCSDKNTLVCCSNGKHRMKNLILHESSLQKIDQLLL